MDDKTYEYEHRHLDLSEVLAMIEDALLHRHPFSLARYGHAEIYYSLWPSPTASGRGLDYYQNYNGAIGDPVEIGKQIIDSLQNTHLAGLYSHHEDEASHRETKQLLSKINYVPSNVCSPFITHKMAENPDFWSMLKPLRVALVGRRAKEAITSFENQGVKVAETYNLEGLPQANHLEKSLIDKKDEWDLAIMAAGIPATIIAERIANATHNVVLDFGHALDKIIDGEAFDFEKLVQNFYEDI
ncbi:hypothetical protein LCM20_07600 [Halobacillus litoralis]|uniref:GT-D fold domain-containing protein n=1 Tax=Halobacillus litoralis TaxID=45668 RepID=UPI001CD64082|nr:GT-D fold domain-containing glycosyltransferase [Halobacillus litoralis]MCA0970446.1 hypothetical protein [Halobacillus litoralis]